MISLLNPGRWLIWIGLAGALVVGIAVRDNHIRSVERALVVAEYNVKINALKAEAQHQLDTETARVTLLNLQLRAFKDTQENEDVVNSKAIALLADKLHTVQLRDPGQVAGCRCSSDSTQSTVTTTPGTGTADTTSSTGILSTVATDFLLNQAKIADILNLAYISCRSDAFNLRR